MGKMIYELGHRIDSFPARRTARHNDAVAALGHARLLGQEC